MDVQDDAVSHDTLWRIGGRAADGKHGAVVRHSGGGWAARADCGWRQESLSTFPTLPKIYSPLILLAQGNVWDNLSRISRDNGGLRLLLTWQGAAWYNVGTKLMEETCIRTRNAVRF